jgi:exodeoxyribonuclease VII large subunit
VGHEIDFTIADFVADLRAPTPSAAAELMSPDQQDHLQQLQIFQQRLSGLLRQQMQVAGNRLEFLRRRLKHPGRRLLEQAQTLDRLEASMLRALRNGLRERNTALTQLVRHLNAVSPLQTLSRGYSISYGEDHAVLRRAVDIKPGARLLTRLSEGSIESTVTRIKADETASS